MISLNKATALLNHNLPQVLSFYDEFQEEA